MRGRERNFIYCRSAYFSVRDRGSQASRRFFHDETGSLIVFISFLFLISLIVSLGIVDISDSYLAKRSLITMGESFLSQGVQQIDLPRYYQDGIDPISGRVPIDCPAAQAVITTAAFTSVVRGVHPQIDSLECIDDSISITLSIEIPPIIYIPFVSGFSNGNQLITAHLQETSLVP